MSSKGRESYDQRLVAARKVTAIYADYQTRKLIVTTVLIVFGATTALLSAAFLVRQTKAMESQLLKLDIQNGSIETQTTAISTQTDLLKLQLENQEKTNAITIELSELESRYKPFWILYNSNSKELRNESFVTLLEDKLLNYNKLFLTEVTTRDDQQVVGFDCTQCEFTTPTFKNDWINPSFLGGFMSSASFLYADIKGGIFSDIRFDGKIKKNGFSQTLFFGSHVQDTSFRDTRILDQVIERSKFTNVSFDGGVIMNTRISESEFKGTVSDYMGFSVLRISNTAIINSRLEYVDLTEVNFGNRVRFVDSVLMNVIFTPAQKNCISFEKTEFISISWNGDGNGKCL